MLDLDHQLTPYVFEASRYEDDIRRHLVTLRDNPSMDPVATFREILAGPLRELRRLLQEQFESRPGIASKLNAIEHAITQAQPIDDVWAAFNTLSELSEDTFGTGFI